jgi:flavin reductase (DIM6/NTAB) family NADH-FMN oxidoreductase RutF/DNA-binding IclR family transcriptional regulator
MTVGPTIDPGAFREVLGHFPTGVVVIAGIDQDGAPAGMAVGSFTSVSLDPPLVAFLPDRSSTSWPKIASSGKFCVNILSAEQEVVCRAFASRGGDKFASLNWKPAPSGSPIIEGVVGWIDCDVEQVHEAGDHWIVVGAVRELDIVDPTLPLVFFRGGYGHFSPLSLRAWSNDLVMPLRAADLARPYMEALANQYGSECIASAVVGDEMVLVAAANGGAQRWTPTQVGQRIPFRAPIGTAFAAWAPPAAQEVWLKGADGSATRDVLETTLAAVRERGYSVGRGSPWFADAFSVLARATPGRPSPETSQELRALIALLPGDHESPAVGPERDAHAGISTVNVPIQDPQGATILVLTLAVPNRRNGQLAAADSLRKVAHEVASALVAEAAGAGR